MATLAMRRIPWADAGSAKLLSALRTQLGPDGGAVSSRSRKLTEKVFGEALTPLQVVERICAEVRSEGLPSVLHYTEQFDCIRVKPDEIQVSPEQLAEAHAAADLDFLQVIRRVRNNILSFQLGLLHTDAVLSVAESHELRLRYRPVRRVGICVPGGAAAYPSTLLMTVCPAQAAGVKELAVVMPPGPHGADNSDLRAVCQELAITEVYRIGGAQAVAALAYGVEGIPPVDMIVGPGNLYVTLAKRHVFGQVGIDMLAGPSEIMILADESAAPDFVAADLIAQAEHAPGVSILVTWHEPLAEEVLKAITKQLQDLSRGDLARESLETYGAIVQTRDAKEALACVNQFAPEHLHIATRQPEELAARVDHAGAIFLGHYSPVALGDYAAGPSHVLPTGGTARFASALSANDFLRRSSVLRFTPKGLERLAGDVRRLAEKEGLSAHAASVDRRLAGLAKSAPGDSQSANGQRDRPPILAGEA
jgi:histidinol dehydrogenase